MSGLDTGDYGGDCEGCAVADGALVWGESCEMLDAGVVGKGVIWARRVLGGAGPLSERVGPGGGLWNRHWRTPKITATATANAESQICRRRRRRSISFRNNDIRSAAAWTMRSSRKSRCASAKYSQYDCKSCTERFGRLSGVVSFTVGQNAF